MMLLSRIRRWRGKVCNLLSDKLVVWGQIYVMWPPFFPPSGRHGGESGKKLGVAAVGHFGVHSQQPVSENHVFLLLTMLVECRPYGAPALVFVLQLKFVHCHIFLSSR